MQESPKIPIGISACLLGEEVRFNGGHKRSRICLNALAQVFEYRSYCPEVAIGMGVPRETIRLEGELEAPRVVGSKTPGLDVTDELYEYGRRVAAESEDLSGYILMKDSPSCGLYSTKVYRNGHPLPGKHQGMFVRGFRAENPLLPMEEEGRLNDPVLKENFVALVHVYDDWRRHFKPDPSPRALVAFHSRYKFLVMAHSQKAYRELGQIVAEAGAPGFEARVEAYFEALMGVLQKPANRKGHVNALYHILGYLKESVDGDARQDISRMIDSYREGHVNLSVPATLLNHYIQRVGSDYINEQAYLRPYSEALGLRNAI